MLKKIYSLIITLIVMISNPYIYSAPSMTQAMTGLNIPATFMSSYADHVATTTNKRHTIHLVTHALRAYTHACMLQQDNNVLSDNIFNGGWLLYNLYKVYQHGRALGTAPLQPQEISSRKTRKEIIAHSILTSIPAVIKNVTQHNASLYSLCNALEQGIASKNNKDMVRWLSIAALSTVGYLDSKDTTLTTRHNHDASTDTQANLRQAHLVEQTCNDNSSTQVGLKDRIFGSDEETIVSASTDEESILSSITDHDQDTFDVADADGNDYALLGIDPNTLSLYINGNGDLVIGQGRTPLFRRKINSMQWQAYSPDNTLNDITDLDKHNVLIRFAQEMGWTIAFNNPLADTSIHLLWSVGHDTQGEFYLTPSKDFVYCLRSRDSSDPEDSATYAYRSPTTGSWFTYNNNTRIPLNDLMAHDLSQRALARGLLIPKRSQQDNYQYTDCTLWAEAFALEPGANYCYTPEKVLAYLHHDGVCYFKDESRWYHLQATQKYYCNEAFNKELDGIILNTQPIHYNPFDHEALTCDDLC